MPVDGIAAINSEPSEEKHDRPKSPFSFKKDMYAPRSGEVSEDCHDETDGNVPVWCPAVERAKNQQCDANSKRDELPRAEVFI